MTELLQVLDHMPTLGLVFMAVIAFTLGRMTSGAAEPSSDWMLEELVRRKTASKLAERARDEVNTEIAKRVGQ